LAAEIAKPLHAAREGVLIVGLDEQVQVVRLDADVDDAVIGAGEAGAERAADRAIHAQDAQVADLAGETEDDVHGVARDDLGARAMTRIAAAPGRLAAGALRDLAGARAAAEVEHALMASHHWGRYLCFTHRGKPAGVCHHTRAPASARAPAIARSRGSAPPAFNNFRIQRRRERAQGRREAADPERERRPARQRSRDHGAPRCCARDVAEARSGTGGDPDPDGGLRSPHGRERDVSGSETCWTQRQNAP